VTTVALVLLCGVILLVALRDDLPRRVRHLWVGGDRVVYGLAELRNQQGMGLAGLVVALLVVAGVVWGLYELVQWLSSPFGT
jgi:hypothetical protein